MREGVKLHIMYLALGWTLRHRLSWNWGILKSAEKILNNNHILKSRIGWCYGPFYRGFTLSRGSVRVFLGRRELIGDLKGEQHLARGKQETQRCCNRFGLAESRSLRNG